jgi:glycosyltransferase involved in cell wall biosynthesis
MRVTMLVRCLAMMRGGGETRHLAWVRELAALGVDVEVIAGRPLAFGGVRYPIDLPNVTLLRSPYARDFVYQFQNRRGFGRLTMNALHADEEWFCRAAWRHILAGPRPDVVHAHALHQTARLGPGDVPVVINLPGEPNARYRADLQQADALVGDGWAADHLPAALGRPVRRVPKGVDAALFTPDGSNERARLRLEQRRVILTVGRLVPIKNTKLLVSAMPAVVDAVPDAHLVIVGDGPERASLEAVARELGISDRVAFGGYVPQGETPGWYRTADLFALSSDFDNSPNVVLEAMASGLPVVSTRVGGVAEFVAERGGVLVPPGDATALAAAIVAMLKDENRRREAGAFNRRAATERFSWRASAQALLETYEDVIAARRRSARRPA